MIDKLQKDYLKLYPNGDTHAELIDDIGRDEYIALLQEAISNKKYIYIHIAENNRDGGQLHLLNTPDEVINFNKKNYNDNIKLFGEPK